MALPNQEYRAAQRITGCPRPETLSDEQIGELDKTRVNKLHQLWSEGRIDPDTHHLDQLVNRVRPSRES